MQTKFSQIKKWKQKWAMLEPPLCMVIFFAAAALIPPNSKFDFALVDTHNGKNKLYYSTRKYLQAIQLMQIRWWHRN